MRCIRAEEQQIVAIKRKREEQEAGREDLGLNVPRFLSVVRDTCNQVSLSMNLLL